MKLYNLSNDATKPCFVLRLNSIVMMLDCGLSTRCLHSFLPKPLVHSTRLRNLNQWLPRDSQSQRIGEELKECQGKVFVDSTPEFCPPLSNMIDFSEIDVILISNHSMMLALPLITENTGFKGIIYATEPTLEISKLYFEELLEFNEESPQDRRREARLWKEVLHLLPSPLSDVYKPKTWITFFGKKEIRDCLARIRVLSYDQEMDVYGVMSVKPLSSGLCLGSCNWLIRTHYEKIVYLSSSSTLTTHPRQIEYSALKKANALILAGLSLTPNINPDNTLGDLCTNVVLTVRGGGGVLIPCQPSGLIYDLLQCVSAHLDQSALSTVPLLVISPVAQPSFAYSNILGEWLCRSKERKVYLPEEPFPHGALLKSGRLKYWKRIFSEGLSSTIKQPCVVFGGHPSLRFGDMVHLMEIWRQDPRNTLILTDGEFCSRETVAPFEPLAMKVVCCPIDTGLNYSQANHLLTELKPNTLVVPREYLKANKPPAPGINQGVVYTVSVDCGEVVDVPVKRALTRVNLSPLLADRLTPTQISPHLSISSLRGQLILKDNHQILDIDENIQLPGFDMPSNWCEYGHLNLQELLTRLKAHNFNNTLIYVNPSGYRIHFDGMTIEGSGYTTHIQGSLGNEHFRQVLRLIVMSCLKSF